MSAVPASRLGPTPVRVTIPRGCELVYAIPEMACNVADWRLARTGVEGSLRRRRALTVGRRSIRLSAHALRPRGRSTEFLADTKPARRPTDLLCQPCRRRFMGDRALSEICPTRPAVKDG
jgi:hypothetical protein